MTQPSDLAEVVGSNARRIRTEAGATLEDVAKAARGHGLKGWGGGRVSDLEHGRVSPTLPTLVALALALGDIRHEPLTLAELVEHQGAVELTGSLVIRGAALARFLDGQPVKLVKRDVPALADVDVTAMIAVGMRHLAKELPPRLRDVSAQTVMAVRDRSGEAEQRTAKALGVSLTTVAAASAYLYRGRTPSEERDRRAGGDATAQKRGRIAREIRAELKGVLNGND